MTEAHAPLQYRATHPTQRRNDGLVAWLTLRRALINFDHDRFAPIATTFLQAQQMTRWATIRAWLI